MSKHADIPVDASREGEAAFMRAFYWKVARTVFLVLAVFGLLVLIPFVLASAVFEALGGGVFVLLSLKVAGALVLCGLAALLLRIVERSSFVGLLRFLPMLAAIGFDCTLSGEARDAGLHWIDRVAMPLGLVGVFAISFWLQRSSARASKESKGA